MLHYIRGMRPFTRVKIQATLYEGSQIIKLDNNMNNGGGLPLSANNQDCNWATSGVDSSGQQMAPRGSKIDILPNGSLQINRPTGIAQGPDELVVPMN